MFGNSIGELANLVTVRSFTQLVFSVCVIVGMFWPVTRAKILWSLALVATFLAVISLSAALKSNHPGFTTLYGIAMSINVALHHAALTEFSGKPLRYRLLVTPPLLSLAFGLVAYWFFDLAMLAVYLINVAQFVVLANASLNIGADRSRLGGRLLLCIGCCAAAAVTLFQAGINFLTDDYFIVAYGIMALGTAMAMIMQNMGWLALQKDSAEIQPERLAHIDGLTGLLNRRGLAFEFQRTLRLAARSQKPLAVMLIDIDHFKSINDNWGHDTGDRVLTSLGALIEQQMRGHDLCARLGGEEFLVVLFDCEPNAAHDVGERLRDAMSEHLHRPDGVPVRFSGGITRLQPGEFDLDRAIARADKALYEAKASGRDCMVQGRVKPLLRAA